MRLVKYLTEEFEIPHKSGKSKLMTKIPPNERSFKNLPRDSKGNPKVRFQDWLEMKGGSDGAKASDGKWYGWSHRAVAGFGVGDVVKPGHIGNKYQYSDDAKKKYMSIMDKDGYEAADKYLDSLGNFEPYTIKSDDEAREHAYRFAMDVS